MKNFLVLIAAMILIGGGVAEAAYPERPIQFIIGWDVGGASDLAGRALCARAEKYLNKPMVIQNLPAGAGAKGYMTIAKSKPDGYTIGLATGTISSVKPAGLVPLDSSDFEPIITFESGPGGIWVHQDAPWKTFKEFAEYVKQRPGEVTIAGSAPGTVTRFQMVLLEQAAGLEFRVLAQKGGAAAGLTALAGKHVVAAMGSPLEGNALYSAGKIRPLAFTSAQRVAIMPDVPTAKEQGYDVELSSTRVILAPKGTPKEIIDTLYQAFRKVVHEPEYRKSLESRGSIVLDYSPEETAVFLKKQDEIFKDIIQKTSQIKN